jgi:hypothetical protein
MNVKQILVDPPTTGPAGYSIFEDDQVLTPDELNSVSDYFEYQTRITRTKLIGVGIVCGLRVSSDGTKVTVFRGSAVTTDGDLLYLNDDTVYDRWQAYDASYPEYPPFDAARNANKIYQLVPAGVKVTPGLGVTALSQLSGLGNMVAVLFMEDFVKSNDICSGTQCDHIGQDFVTNIKVLLIDKSFANALSGSVATVGDFTNSPAEILVDRPILTASVNSTNSLQALYRATCKLILGNLITFLGKVYPVASLLPGQTFTSDPTIGWIRRLKKLDAAASTPLAILGLQYYYDFLKDLAETCNAFRELLFGDNTCCCPNFDLFPKHVLLGVVVPGPDPNEHRTSFYASPIVSPTIDRLRHAAFLMRKLDTLVATFELPKTSVIKITPSSFEETPLEERAIPFYYKMDANHPIEQSWNYRLHQEKQDGRNYSYNADIYTSGQGVTTTPSRYQIGCFNFFRVEGHLGQDILKAQRAIEQQIAAQNLPFVVERLLLETDPKLVIPPFVINYTDLHRLHYILRNDLSYQLEDTKTFSNQYASQVKLLGADQVSDVNATRRIAAQNDTLISDRVPSAQAILNLDYPSYKERADSWAPLVKDTMTAAADFKQNLTDVTKTDFTTPFDSLLATSHINWLNWLDILIQNKNDDDAARKLFSNYLSAHPGMEHYAGVVRGGTLVLAYNSSRQVIADFMLPYRCCEPQPQPVVEPPLKRPPLKDINVIKGGVTLVTAPSLAFRKAADDYIGPKLQTQQQTFDFFKNSMTTVASVFSGAVGRNVVVGKVPTTTTTSPALDAVIGDPKAKEVKLAALRQSVGDPNLSAQARKKYLTLTNKAEGDLASSVHDAVKFISDMGVDVSPGSEGRAALDQLSQTIGRVTSAKTQTSLKNNLKRLRRTTRNSELKGALDEMIGG